jgi:hypothetical protein
MADFPDKPVLPKEFMEGFVTAALGEADLDEGVDLKLGVQLVGPDGGEWVVELAAGSFSVAASPRDEAAFTLVQSVDDWRGALWEGRGGVFGEQAANLLTAGGNAESPPPNPAVIEQLAALDALVEIAVTADEGGDWSLAFKLGPGEIPAEPTTKIVIASADARALQDGSLDAMQAFMSGKIQVIGDMALIMQIQAISMQAAAAG